jgi:hypothetical protein
MENNHTDTNRAGTSNCPNKHAHKDDDDDGDDNNGGAAVSLQE